MIKLTIVIIMMLTLTMGAMLTKLPITRGLASFYGIRFAGKKTAYGEAFNPKELTCASQFYPKNTILTVYYPRTRLSVTVRVNDRGPWIKGRTIDLSERAAELIGLKKVGVDYVIITPQT
jgi:rare lipoprotein A